MVSLRGRDRGQRMVVLRVVEPGSAAERPGVYVADGKRRPVQRPKRKNPRHLALCGRLPGEATMATNREIRRALRLSEEAQSR